ncbi:MAG TPA: DUF1614 domain-containing protein [Candidatus Binataceae bacterium]|nr:DUF1614 domain-containing protein [Candidatus Binataceae bacterium]
MVSSPTMFFAPFLFLYAIIFFFALVVVFALLELGAIDYAFHALGLPPHAALWALIISLLGSYINIPVSRIESGGEPPSPDVVGYFGMRYRVPAHLAAGRSTVVAINVGGAIVPLCICAWILAAAPAVFLHAVLGTAIVTFIVHRAARPIPGVGIATPMFIPPIAAALVGWLLSGGVPHHADAIAYVSGVMGTLIGADLMNLGRLGELGAPVASIGGAGTFDGIFLTGIVAVLLA